MQDKFSAAGTCSPVRFEAYLPLNRSPFRAAPAVSVRSATVQNAIPYRFRRLRPSLVAQCNEGCSCGQSVFCCLTGALYSGYGKDLAHGIRVGEGRLQCKPCELHRSSAFALHCGSAVSPVREPRRSGQWQARCCIDLRGNAHVPSIPETAEDAMYSSLRRKKSPTESGEPRSTQKVVPGPAWSRAGVASGAKRLEASQALIKTRLCDLLKTLEPTPKAESKA
jgi:hypothetical protein